MKTITFIKRIIRGAAPALLCGFILTSCWDGFTDSFIGQYKSVPPDLLLTNSSMTSTSVILNWTEPDAPSYTGVKITCTGKSDQIVNKGTTTCTISSLSGSTEYTITVTALYDTGDEFVDAEFKVTPPSANQPLRFIYTAEELAAVNTNLGYYYILMADIDLSGYSNWTPFGKSTPFTGTFDGNGHVISRLLIDYSALNDQNLGLFCVNDGTIKNLGITDVNIISHLTTENIGALVGWNHSGIISKCYSTGIITGYRVMGGLVGINDGTISDSHAMAAVTVTGSGTGSGEFIGGLTGYNSGPINNCYATGPVTGISYTGGLSGANSGTINNCYATGPVTGSGSCTGGLVGENQASISDCYATGSVTVSGTGFGVGGLVGNNTLLSETASASISNCHATGAVKGTGYRTGGLVGYNNNASSIRSSYATGPVSGNIHTGGLVGENDQSIIENCYATGEVTGTAEDTGGLSGYFYQGTISYCYSTGRVTGTTGVGAFAGGYNSVTPTSCFYNSTTAGQGDLHATGKITTDMKLQGTFNGWDFTGTPPTVPPIWSRSDSINGGYPYLTGMAP